MQRWSDRYGTPDPRYCGSQIRISGSEVASTVRSFSEVTEQSLRREICGHPGATQILRKSLGHLRTVRDAEKNMRLRAGISGVKDGRFGLRKPTSELAERQPRRRFKLGDGLRRIEHLDGG